VREKKTKKQTVRKKIKYKRLFIVLIFLLGIIYGIYSLLTVNITNIFIIGNDYITDQTIIEQAQLQDYPKAISIWSFQIAKKIKDIKLIKSVNVHRKHFTQLYIEIEENQPLVFSINENKTWLIDGQKVEEKFEVPILTNDIPTDLQNVFLEDFAKIDNDIRTRISEIKYDPNVDEKRFLFTMNDGNYVYITLDNITNINNYLNIIKNFPNKKGILYLDEGSHFKVFE